MKKHIITAISVLLIASIFMTSCLSMNNGSTLTESDIEKLAATITESSNAETSAELKALLESQGIETDGEITTESLNIVNEDGTAIGTGTSTEESSDVFVEENLDDIASEDEIYINGEPINSLVAESEEETVEDVTFEPIVIEGTSVLDNGNFTAGDSSWMSGQEMTGDLKPATFVSAEELPLETAGRDLSSISTVTAEEPKIIWDDEVVDTYTPTVTATSDPVDIYKERDILKEYEQFIADLGDDYTVAKSDDITLDDLLNETETTVTVTEESIEPKDELYAETESDETWTTVPEETKTVETEEEEKTNSFVEFFKGLWNDIKTLFVNLWTKLKGTFTKKSDTVTAS